VRSAKLREDYAIDGRCFKAGQIDDLDEAGRVRAGCLADGDRFVRIGDSGTETPATLPQLDASSWVAATGGRTTFARVSAAGLVYGTNSRTTDPCCTCRELLEGAFNEALQRDLGDGKFRELIYAAERVYRAVSDSPLEFEVTI
jgi:hypothetical protein